ncbi:MULTISPECIES: hypothetical protein [Clostridium]|uniref:Uncharacterized protein n=1 Tax=Clostridium neuense TaxID=1728934 RepID=A0ABW8TFZ3_9CLOT|nr:hypothetical protein [Clostridium guangxiense]MCD2345776.1 hypothetical protein [Clostridium guangxiense]
MIAVVSIKRANEIIDKCEPVGLFLVIEDDMFVGIDNSTGEAWTEEFTDLNKCLRWLHGGNLDETEEIKFEEQSV